MARLGKMQIGEHVKEWSYQKIEKVFGKYAEQVAEVVGVKKPSKKELAKEDKKED